MLMHGLKVHKCAVIGLKKWTDIFFSLHIQFNQCIVYSKSSTPSRPFDLASFPEMIHKVPVSFCC